MPWTRECRLRSLRLLIYLLHSVSSPLDIRHTENYTLYVRCRPFLIRNVLRLDHHRDASGDFFIPAFQCPHRVQRVGTLGDGGKWVCGLDRVVKQDKCVIYSFGMSHLPLRHPLLFAPRCRLDLLFFTGINGESSFESTLLKRGPNCEAWGYDYSVNSVRVLLALNPTNRTARANT